MDMNTIAILVAAICPTLVALLSYLASLRNEKALQEIHISINSRLDELMTASNAVARSEGHEAGRQGKQ